MKFKFWHPFGAKDKKLKEQALHFFPHLTKKLELISNTFYDNKFYSHGGMEVKLRKLYLEDESKEILFHAISKPAVCIFASYDEEEYIFDDQENSKKLLRFMYFLIGKTLFSKKLPTILETLNTKFEYSHFRNNKNEICNILDFIKTADCNTEYDDVKFALKKFFLGNDGHDFDIMFQLHDILVNSQLKDKYLINNLSGINLQHNTLELLFYDYPMLANFVAKYRNIEKLFSEAVHISDRQTEILHIIYLIYVRNLLYILLFFSICPFQEWSSKVIGSTIARKYFEIGYLITNKLQSQFSVQDYFIYYMDELKFDILTRTYYQNPLINIDAIQSYLSSLNTEKRYSKYDDKIEEMLNYAQTELENDPNLFHDQIISFFERKSKYKEFFTKKGFKKRLTDLLKKLIEKIGKGKIRGLKNK